MAYLKWWAPRASNPLELREPHVVAGPAGEVTRRDANELASELVDYDCTYIDPPYNQHSYFNNYHVWETLVRNDEPEYYGVACKRIDCKTTKSPYNSKRQASAALDDLIGSIATPWLIVSFNNEGFHDPAHVKKLLGERGYVNTLEVDFKRYVGAQIGIFNPDGEKVGKVSHLRNKEVLFVVGPDRGRIERAFDSVSPEAEQAALF
jgi:adenine-specific DNA-methyltransferase